MIFAKMEAGENDVADIKYETFPSLRLFSKYNTTIPSVWLDFDEAVEVEDREFALQNVGEVIQKGILSELWGDIEELQKRKKEAVEVEDFDAAKASA